MEGLLVLLVIIGIGNMAIAWFAWRQQADRDGDRKDWWEQLVDSWEPARKLEDARRAAAGLPPHDDKRL